MPDALAPVRAGAPLRISACVYNHLLSLLRARQVDHAAAGDTGQSRRCANTTAWVRNNASTTLERYSPVGIDGYSFTVNHELILHGTRLVAITWAGGGLRKSQSHRGNWAWSQWRASRIRVSRCGPIHTGALTYSITQARIALCQRLGGRSNRVLHPRGHGDSLPGRSYADHAVRDHDRRDHRRWRRLCGCH